MDKHPRQKHLIYIPGFGDKYDTYRRHALKKWKSKGLSVEFLPMNWRDTEETYKQKLQRVVERIRKASNTAEVVLVGESAGGAMVVVASQVCRKEVTRAITICGKNIREDRVSPMHYERSPAFREAILEADKLAEKITLADIDRYTTFYSAFDPVIAAVDTKLPHIPLRKLPFPGHLLTIFAVLYFYWPIIIKEALR